MCIFSRGSVWGVAILGLLMGGCTYPPPFWAKDRQLMTIPVGNLDSVQVNTHSGHVHLVGDEGAEDIQVLVKKAAGGSTPRDAKACMEAVKVFAEQAGTTQKLGWKWKVVRPLRWQAQVSFEVRLPKRFASVIHARNGEIHLENVEGDTRLIMHNGGVIAQDFTGDADIETYNGLINVKGRPDHIRLVTHNGRIEADLRGSGSIAGCIITYNGGIQLALGEGVDTILDFGTHKGFINSEVNLQDVTIKDSQITGRLGQGGEKLKVSTHNGSLTLTN